MEDPRLIALFHDYFDAVKDDAPDTCTLAKTLDPEPKCIGKKDMRALAKQLDGDALSVKALRDLSALAWNNSFKSAILLDTCRSLQAADGPGACDVAPYEDAAAQDYKIQFLTSIAPLQCRPDERDAPGKHPAKPAKPQPANPPAKPPQTPATGPAHIIHI